MFAHICTKLAVARGPTLLNPFSRALSSRHVNPAPKQTKLGVLKLVTVIVPSICMGGLLSKKGALTLEEWRIYSLKDDEEDE